MPPPSRFEQSVREPWLRDVLAGWKSWRDADGEVRRSALDPVALPRMSVPYLFIYELRDGRWRCALSGSGIVGRAGYDPGGRHLDEILDGPALDARIRLFGRAIERGCACVYSGWLAITDRPYIRFERLLLPVVGRSGRRDALFGALAFPDNATSARSPLANVAEPESIIWDED